MLGVQPWDPFAKLDQEDGTVCTAGCPSPWLRAWVEFQVDARINQALRDLAEGELVALLAPSHGEGAGVSSSPGLPSSCNSELQRVAEAQAGLLSVVEGLATEVEGLAAAVKRESSSATTVQLEDTLARVSFDTARLDERLHLGLQEAQSQASAMCRPALERLEQLEQRLSSWQADVSAKLYAETQSNASNAAQAGIAASVRRLDKEVSSTADAWKNHEARLSRLESDITSSAEVHLRHEACFERMARELGSFSETRNRLDALERQQGEAHARHDSRFERFSDELAVLSEGQSLLERLERELSLSAAAHGKHEGRFERLTSDIQCLGEVRGHFDQMRGEFVELKESMVSHARRLDCHEEKMKPASCDSMSAQVEQLQAAVASLTEAQGSLSNSLKSMHNDAASTRDSHTRLQSTVEQLGQHEIVSRLESLERDVAAALRDQGQQLKQLAQGLHSAQESQERDHSRLEQLAKQEEENARQTREALAVVQRQQTKDEHVLSRAGSRMERLERELEFSMEAHARHEGRFERVEGRLMERLARLEKELAAASEDRYQELSLALASTKEVHAAHRAELGDLAQRLGDLAAGSERSRQGDLDFQIQELRAEIRDLDFENRLRQGLHDTERRLDEARKRLREDFELWQSSLEQDVAALQRKGAAELRVEVRTAIRNEAAAVAALDEQLWLTDQRLGGRIDEMEQTIMSGSATSPPTGSTPPPAHLRVPAVMRPITPCRDSALYRQRPKTIASAFAARAVDSVSDASSDADPQAMQSGSLSGAEHMASAAAEALTRNIDIRRRSRGGLSSCSGAASTPVDQDRDVLLEVDETTLGAHDRSCSSRRRQNRADSPTTGAGARLASSRSPASAKARQVLSAAAAVNESVL
eukprot:TRINITY_DN27247_c0_g1_i1.p1 TRINITY_DN27247_c0_g1~~TRINITY_DN27247_c0_g1_i1.p1  ORF type:complete len:894 (+),score=185.94 TRINITY_DN27247_c0_g1_i1:48-2684(+)